MRLTYKLEEPINTKYLHYNYMIVADYDVSRGNFGRIADWEIYNKLGQYEDIDTDPTRLAIIKLALEIIKNKRVNVFWLMECISCYHENALKRYNEDVLCKDIDCLTQEEYDLLKEAFYGLPTKQVWYSN